MAHANLLIGADLVPTPSNYDAFCAADVNSLVDDDLKQLVESASYTLFNLEVPLANQNTPIEKWGPNLIAPTATIAGLKALNKGAFALANNHIMDQGAPGLRSTISALDEAGLAHVGAGRNLAEASEPLYFEVNGWKVGVYACAEHEFSIATDVLWGANPFDALASLEHVHAMKANCDYAIVLYHGGKEHYRYPSPQVRSRCRKLVEAGADLVLCQHSHCIGCKEEWLEGTIVYGQGNFLFDDVDDTDNEFWQTSLLVGVELGEKPALTYYPLRKTGSSVTLAQGEDAQAILGDFTRRSSEIQVPGFVEDTYGAYAKEHLDDYLGGFMIGSGFILFRVLNNLTHNKLRSMLLHRGALLRILNYVTCEAHNELIAEGIQQRLSDSDQAR